MKKILKFLAIFCLAMVQTVFAQNINLKFKGATNDGKYVQLDSVRIENISRSWTETLVYPDTVLSFSFTGIGDAQVNAINNELVSYPNPFDGITHISLTLSQNEAITLQVYNIAGQRIMDKRVQAEAGENLFEISLQHTQVYFLIVNTSNGRLVQKLINLSKSGDNSISYLGTKQTTEIIQPKTQKLLSTKEFQSGDVLRIRGFVTHNGNVVASNEILQPQTASENFTLFFALQASASLPTISTIVASNITSATATSGGNITSDGGATVTARGVCWSTSQNPTVSNSHTTDGNGIGSFTSSITGLTADTTYYVRAYATNAAGTAYGNQITFVTLSSRNGVFSVSSTAMVYFSPGNLQWSATNGGSTASIHVIKGGSTAAGTWRFAPNQWDIIGANNKNISSTYSGWVDLFGWGTSGYNGSYPYMTSTTYTDYGNGNNDILGTDYDWGVYNAIYNPQTNTTDAPGTWRTLTKGEWEYLLNTRSTSSGVRYAKACVMGKNGLIIVPDNWSTSVYALQYTNTVGADYMTNIINYTDWIKMENVGCVFLPAAGGRYWAWVGDVGSYGYYWSAAYNNSYSAYDLDFGSSSLYPSDYIGRHGGESVRLVRDVQ